MDWLEFLGRYGLPTIILVAIGLFFAKQIWPFIVRAWESQQVERREEREKFLETLAEERRAFKEVVDAERSIRIDERNRFLKALDGHRVQLEIIAKKIGSEEKQHG